MNNFSICWVISDSMDFILSVQYILTEFIRFSDMILPENSAKTLDDARMHNQLS